MAETASIFDLVDEDELRRAVELAREDFAAGRSVPHEVAAEWLERLANGERPAPPISSISTNKP